MKTKRVGPSSKKSAKATTNAVSASKSKKAEVRKPKTKVPEPTGFLVIDLSKIVTRFEGVAANPIEPGSKSDKVGPSTVRITIDVPIAAVQTPRVIVGDGSP
jgi:hypothetical protein